jgi:hypothetical protein
MARDHLSVWLSDDLAVRAGDADDQDQPTVWLKAKLDGDGEVLATVPDLLDAIAFVHGEQLDRLVS